MNNTAQMITDGKAVLGIEFGSTRIKAVLVDEAGKPIASGAHDWENQLVDGIWTYGIDAIWEGLADCYRGLAEDVNTRYGVAIRTLRSIGISGMMHGYMAFDEKDTLLAPFRTWRNTITGQACEELSPYLNFNVPQRWSAAHLYQAILKGEEHVKKIKFQTTLAGYIHWQLTGEKVVGIGEAAGMFPIDSKTRDYNQTMVEKFDEKLDQKGMPYKLRDIFPKVLVAGENAGTLSAEGAKKLDPTGTLQPGIPMCPPEGDAGTGMVATNAVAVRTGNVSAGTSVFAMVVLEEELKNLHEELDMVTTPAGDAVAMVHCNNCTSDLNSWVNIFKEFAESFGIDVDMNKLYGTLYNKAMEGDKDCGGLLAYNYFSGEHITGFTEGRPLFVRTPDAKFNLANFMRVNLYTALGALKCGLNILLKEEQVKIDCIYGHGGLFKTKGVGQSILAAAMDAPVAVMETAGEGGAWGIALLALYMVSKEADETLAEYLNHRIFAGEKGEAVDPNPADVEGFDQFIELYRAGLPIEAAAVAAMRS